MSSRGLIESIANHLEKLTDKCYNKEELSNSALETYNRGENVCKIWTNQYNDLTSSEHEHDTYNSDSLASWTEDSGSYFSYGSSYESFRNNDTNRKYSFYESTYDLLGRVIIIKVYSHQTKTDFTKNNHTSKLCPNRFAVTTNQIADNAATQAHKLFERCNWMELNHCVNPPFSSRWNFTFEGQLINKGATNLFYETLDEELLSRQQHRPKQGALLPMLPFNSLNTDQIGDETLLRNILKLTAPCWTRCVYRFPPLANQIWTCWRYAE